MHKTPTRNGYESTLHRDGSVTYWSVYRKEWTRVYSQAEIPDREWAAADEQTRARFAGLPVEEPA